VVTLEAVVVLLDIAVDRDVLSDVENKVVLNVATVVSRLVLPDVEMVVERLVEPVVVLDVARYTAGFVYVV
jgi:hypothetical protein